MRESVKTRVMGMKSLISFMTRNIPCRIAFLYGIWYDVCVPLHVNLVGSSPCRRISLLGITHSVVGPPFRYKECTGIQPSDKAMIAKEANMWP